MKLSYSVVALTLTLPSASMAATVTFDGQAYNLIEPSSIEIAPRTFSRTIDATENTQIYAGQQTNLFFAIENYELISPNTYNGNFAQQIDYDTLLGEGDNEVTFAPSDFNLPFEFEPLGDSVALNYVERDYVSEGFSYQLFEVIFPDTYGVGDVVSISARADWAHGVDVYRGGFVSPTFNSDFETYYTLRLTLNASVVAGAAIDPPTGPTVAPIPLPATFPLMALTLSALGLGLYRRRD